MKTGQGAKPIDWASKPSVSDAMHRGDWRVERIVAQRAWVRGERDLDVCQCDNCYVERKQQ